MLLLGTATAAGTARTVRFRQSFMAEAIAFSIALRACTIYSPRSVDHAAYCISVTSIHKGCASRKSLRAAPNCKVCRLSNQIHGVMHDCSNWDLLKRSRPLKRIDSTRENSGGL